MEVSAIIEAVIICLIITVAVTGNISLWIIICKSRDLQTVTNMFILGLSAADLLVSAINMPLTVSAVVANDWPFSESACTILGFFNMLFLVTSVMSLCNISINRYCMVCLPHKFKNIYTTRNAIFMITGVVSLSVLLSSPPLFGWGKYSYITVQSFCFCDWSMSTSYAIFMIICCFGGPFSVMTVCNIFIYRSVRASSKRVSKISPAPLTTTKRTSATETELSKIDVATTSVTVTDRDSGTSTTVALRVTEKLKKKAAMKRKSASEIMEQRLAMSLIVVVIVFVISWLPYCISMLLLIFHDDSVPRIFHMFTITLGYANSCCNPIIYGLMNTQFAKGFRDLYCWWRKKC